MSDNSRRKLVAAAPPPTAFSDKTSVCSLYPYKMCVKQTLSDGDKEGRKMFSSWLVEMCRQSESFFDNIWFSDEAHFYLDGHVSPQNCRFWAAGDASITLQASGFNNSKRQSPELFTRSARRHAEESSGLF